MVRDLRRTRHSSTMTTADAFRHLALSLPRAVEKPILGSQEFRVRDKAFATLGWPQAGWAVVRLTPGDQAKFMAKSQALAPEPGGRGRRGVTRVRLAGLDQALLAPLVTAAWRVANAAYISSAKT
jgi:hypothetical protein